MSNKTAEKYQLQVKRNAELQWVHLSKMKINLSGQREFNQNWANQLLAAFDPDKMQTPHVNFRDGYFFIMDGQHTIDALKRWLGKWEDQVVQCWVYQGLSEEDEAEKYLSLNNKKNADTFQKFRISVKAGRKIETEISSLIESIGLKISNNMVPGAIKAVATLKKAYKRDGADALRNGLIIASESYGDSGLTAPVIDGLCLLTHRYNGTLSHRNAIESLQKISGGVNGLMGMANVLRLKTGNSRADCLAAAAVSVINRRNTSKSKLPSWWKE
jgi:hypothetical protein